MAELIEKFMKLTTINKPWADDILDNSNEEVIAQLPSGAGVAEDRAELIEEIESREEVSETPEVVETPDVEDADSAAGAVSGEEA